MKLREDGRIVSMAVRGAVAVNTDGRREILGITVMPSEAETFWADFLRSLTRRGLRGVQLVISDAHEGLKAAARKVLGAGWQRCRVHFQRNLLARAGKTHKPVVSAVVKTVFAEKDRDRAHLRWREVADNLRDRFRDVAERMDEAEHDILAYMAFDESLRAKLHGTDGIDKTFLPFPAILLSCGRPRGEAWRVGWKRRRAACSVPAGLRRSHTCLSRADASARRR